LLRRVLKALAEQEFPDYEVVVVDDVSEDETWALLEGWQGERKIAIRVDSQNGSYAARNVGWRAASADLIATRRSVSDELLVAAAGERKPSGVKAIVTRPFAP